jgi:hypothetical protein
MLAGYNASSFVWFHSVFSIEVFYVSSVVVGRQFAESFASEHFQAQGLSRWFVRSSIGLGGEVGFSVASSKLVVRCVRSVSVPSLLSHGSRYGCWEANCRGL